MGINDALIALCCLFWVEVAYKIYHKERIQKYKDAVNQSLDDPYLSSKIVAISSGISFLIHLYSDIFYWIFCKSVYMYVETAQSSCNKNNRD